MDRTPTTLTTPHLRGRADDRVTAIVERLDGALAADPDLSFQAAAFHEGAAVLDVWGGPHLTENAVMVPYSVTKVTIGLTVGLLIERGQVDLDERVAHYWPEFAAKGKGAVTVRQLLSHQAGIPQATPALTWAELLDDHAAAARLADTRPFWHPGTAFGYHAVVIGNLASELVFRVTGRTLHHFYEHEIRRLHDVDFYLGLPAVHDARRVTALPMTAPETAGPAMQPTALGLAAWVTPGPPVDLGNDEASWRYGHPSGSGTGSARGLARLLAAAVTGTAGAPPFLSADTVAQLGQQQVHGYDEVLGMTDRAHGIVFQKATSTVPFGGPRALGHDGARGAFACVDPDTGVAFAWTIARAAWPGGADPRAVAIARELGELLRA